MNPQVTSLSPHWEHFHHGADVGVRGFGRTLEEAFAQAALAVTGVMIPPGEARQKESVRIECDAPDREILLVDFLNAVIFEISTRKLLLGRFDVRISDGVLRAQAWGETAEPGRHEPAVEPKGATFTQLKVEHTPEGWLAQCVIDA